MNGLSLLILLLSHLMKGPSLTTQVTVMEHSRASTHILPSNEAQPSPQSFFSLPFLSHPGETWCSSCLSEEKRCLAEVKAEVTFSGSVFLVWLFLRES